MGEMLSIDRPSSCSIHRSFRMRLVFPHIEMSESDEGRWGPVRNKWPPAHSTVSLFSISLTPLTETRSVWLAAGNPLSCVHCHIHCQLIAWHYRQADYGPLNFCIPIGNICVRFVCARVPADVARDGCLDETLKTLERSSRADRHRVVRRPRASWNAIRCRNWITVSTSRRDESDTLLLIMQLGEIM